MSKTLTVYILKCSNGAYYVGVTNNLLRRVSEHNQGLNPGAFTFNKRPVEVVWQAVFTDYHEAINIEKKLKRWSVKKKEALIKGEYETLPELAKKKFSRE